MTNTKLQNRRLVAFYDISPGSCQEMVRACSNNPGMRHYTENGQQRHTIKIQLLVHTMNICNVVLQCCFSKKCVILDERKLLLPTDENRVCRTDGVHAGDECRKFITVSDVTIFYSLLTAYIVNTDKLFTAMFVQMRANARKYPRPLVHQPV